jgi:hypothetical protein
MAPFFSGAFTESNAARTWEIVDAAASVLQKKSGMPISINHIF